MSRDYLDPPNLLSWTQRFVRFPSEQTADLETAADIHAFIEQCVSPLLKDAGLTCTKDTMGNLHASAGPQDAAHEIALFAYAMTHPRAAMQNPFEGELLVLEGEEWIRGRGVSEQKAAMAASLGAFLTVAQASPKRRLSWTLLTAGETGRHDAIAAALTAMRAPPRFAILAIGTAGALTLGHRGRLDVEVLIEGRACHSSAPWLGVDTTRGVREILTIADQIHGGFKADSRLGPASLVCTSIKTSPEATHTLQGTAHLQFDRRLAPAESPDQVLADLQAAFELDPPLVASTSAGAYMYGYCLDEECELVESIRSALKEAELVAPSVEYSLGALDGGYLARAGIQALSWGPGHPGFFHSDEERVRVAEIAGMARAYEAALEGLVA